MAKIHKITMYVVDSDDRYDDVDDLIDDMMYRTDAMLAAPPETETKEFEWDDDLIINDSSCAREQCEQFYNELDAKMGEENYFQPVYKTEDEKPPAVSDWKKLNDFITGGLGIDYSR